MGNRAKGRGVLAGMDPWQVIPALHDLEMDGGIETEWDPGMRVWIGGGERRRVAEHRFLRREFDAVGA